MLPLTHRLPCNDELNNSILTKLEKVRYNENMIICSTVIARLIGKLESGKSSGLGDISPESLKFANNRLSVLLSLCFSICLSHGYMPSDMIKTTIVLIVENKCGNLSESSN